jgi:hypothetical protein
MEKFLCSLLPPVPIRELNIKTKHHLRNPILFSVFVFAIASRFATPALAVEGGLGRISGIIESWTQEVTDDEGTTDDRLNGFSGARLALARSSPTPPGWARVTSI